MKTLRWFLASLSIVTLAAGALIVQPALAAPTSPATGASTLCSSFPTFFTVRQCIEVGLQKGLITEAQAHEWLVKLDSAEDAVQRGDIHTAVNVLRTLLREVQLPPSNFIESKPNLTQTTVRLYRDELTVLVKGLIASVESNMT